MADEGTTGAAEQPAGTTIRDALNAAVTANETTATETTADTGASETGAESQTEGGPARDAAGRFARREAEAAAAAAEKAATEQKPATETEKPVGEQKPVDAKPGEPPAHWSAADKALVAKLPPEHRAEVVERFKAIEAGFTPKLQRAAALEKDYGDIDKMFEPHAQAMQAQGWSKGTLIKAWADVEAQLARDPEAALLNIAKSYRIDPAKLVARLGGAAPAQQQAVITGTDGKPAATDANGEYVDPQIAALNKRIEELSGTVTGMTEAQKRQQEAEQRASLDRTHTEIQAFADAKGEDGSPSHPYFADVAADMVDLAAAERQAGRSPKLQDLYERAVWANRATRAKQIAAETTKAEAKARAEVEKAQRDAAAAAKARTTAAQRAGASVTGAPSGSGQASNPKSRGSLRADLEAAIDETA
jgi:hypothetical protein